MFVKPRSGCAAVKAEQEEVKEQFHSEPQSQTCPGAAPPNEALAQSQRGQQRASDSGVRLDNVKLATVKRATSGCDFQSEIPRDDAQQGPLCTPRAFTAKQGIRVNV